jgi:hypothetical protein
MLTTASSVKNCITGLSPFIDAFGDARVLAAVFLTACMYYLSERYDRPPNLLFL